MSARRSGEQATSAICPVKVEGKRILLLDQRKLPQVVEHFDATSLDDMCLAIKEMVVRGAPAIGVAAALGLASQARRLATQTASAAEFLAALKEAKDRLQLTRPTAVNLSWGTEQIFQLASELGMLPLDQLAESLFARAHSMIEEDIRVNLAIGEYGADLLGKSCRVLTHCNAGALATCGWGTALGVIRTAVKRGATVHVFVDETRPRQQGARLTVWELMQDNITPTLIADSTAGYLMAEAKLDLVIVGADRIAINGDTANKIGTYSLAVLASAHRLPFYVAAPLSTFDPELDSGSEIPIEERDPCEITSIAGLTLCPPGVDVLNPAFDVTPSHLITGIITEAGICCPPYRESIQKLLASQKRKPVRGPARGQSLS